MKGKTGLTRKEIRRICTEGAKAFIEDGEIAKYGVCHYLSNKGYSSNLRCEFENLFEPNDLELSCEEGTFGRMYWLKLWTEDCLDTSARNRRAIALLLAAEVLTGEDQI